MDSPRDPLQRAILCCLINSTESTANLCREYDIRTTDFDSPETQLFFQKTVVDGCLEPSFSDDESIQNVIQELSDFLPTTANARYYVEEFHELIRDSRT